MQSYKKRDRHFGVVWGSGRAGISGIEIENHQIWVHYRDLSDMKAVQTIKQAASKSRWLYDCECSDRSTNELIVWEAIERLLYHIKDKI